MYIKELACRNFRNYENVSLELSPGINFFGGNNAAGKTNLLEAVSVLSNIKSFRNVPDSEIIRWGEGSYFCSLRLNDSRDELFEIGCGLTGDRIQKKAKIDGIIQKRISDYFGRFLTVVFSPEDILLITGPPELRRRLIDSIISKTDPDYLNALSDYRRILNSRNRILRDIREKNKSGIKELDVWDDMLSRRASVIIKKRFEFLDKFNPWFRESDKDISDSMDSVEIDYKTSLDLQKSGLNNGIIPETAGELCAIILKEMEKFRKNDIISGATGTGPHRDDFLFTSGNKLFRNIASQGQKRTACISLKLAEYKYIENSAEDSDSQKPVILMDDVLGELDDGRREKILGMVGNSGQIIISGVHDFPDSENTGIQKFMIMPGGEIIRL